MRFLTALVLCLVVPACAGNVVVERNTGERLRRPRFVQRNEHGVVHAYDRALAVRAAGVLEVVGPRLQRLLPYSAELPEVWICEQPRVTGSDGVYLEGDSKKLIALGTEGASSLGFTLTHELAHWYSHASGVELPVAVEEGLADMAAMRALPEAVEGILQTRRADANPTSLTLREALALSYEEWATMPGEAGLELRSIGFLLVLNLGMEDLAELRETARAQGLDRVPAEWFLGEGPGAAYPRLKAE